MRESVLSGFDHVMAGLSTDDVEQAGEREQLTAPAATPSAAGSTQDHSRAVDPYSRALARRILGHGHGHGCRDGHGAAVRPIARVPLRCIPITGGAETYLDDSFTGVLIIGRAEGGVHEPDRQLVIDRAVVSRRHCQVIMTAGGFGVIDLGAANATGVLRRGSLHRVGATPFVLQRGDLISTLHGEYPMVHVEAARS